MAKRKFDISKAEREQLKFSAMYMGATGSGKTVGALITAKGLVQGMYPDLDPSSQKFWDKIGVIDTEHNRSKIYADTTIGEEYIGRFLHVEFEPPFDVEGYIAAAETLKSAGANVIIVDSLTHAWADTGGLLELHNDMGGQFATWKKINPIIKRLYAAFTADPDVHIITTVRSKMKYEATTSETGKMGVSKIGLKPVMRDDFEYEVLSALHFDEDHKVTVVKDNTQVFDTGVFMSAEYGKTLYEFLTKGIDITAKREERRKQIVANIEDLVAVGDKQTEVIMKTVSQQAQSKYGLPDWRDLPLASLQSVYTRLSEALNG
jgi:hypothetical protein